MTEPTAPPTPTAEAPPPRPAAEIRAQMLPLLRGSPEWKASAAELGRL
jgi:hypothetical protein